jgi:hypothetical protein
MENHEHHHQVRIHIDQKPYESPNPTTGEALTLGQCPRVIRNCLTREL